MKNEYFILEYWKEIKEFPKYKVSTTGKVKTNKNHLMKPQKDNDGYLYLGLCGEDKRYWRYVHQLVAQAFISNPDSLIEVNHKDENKTNNEVLNLEWCTHKYNINYGTGVERRAKTQTGKHHKKK